MVTKPSTPRNPLDARLHALADPELAGRLIAEHPELYIEAQPGPRAAHHERHERAPLSATGADSQEAPRKQTDFWRMIAILGLLLAVGASYALGALMRSRLGADVVPSVSLVPSTHGSFVSAASVRHDNLGPAAARELERAHPRLTSIQSEKAAQAVVAADKSRQTVAPQMRPIVAPQRIHTRILALQTQRAPSPKFRDQVSTLHSSLSVSSVAADASASDSGASNAGDPADASAQSPNSGRQISSGPVWSENGPGVVIPGSIVIAGGRSPGGGGMPGGCPRGRFRP